MSWLDDLLLQHSEMESPRNFWLWAGLCAISAVVKDNVWLNRAGAFKTYPNIYVILHADSGMKKGPPINLAYELVKMVNNTKIIRGRSSIQGILKMAGQAQTRPGGKVDKSACIFICSSELNASLVQDPAALTIMTDLYDRHYNAGDWGSLLKMEEFSLVNPTVTMFGGINDAHAESLFSNKDLQGGFLARTFVIYEKNEQTINSLAKRMKYTPDKEQLSLYLKELSLIKGPFVDLADDTNTLTPVGRYYDEWYNSFRKQIKEMGVKDETGTLNRLGDSVLKIAMLLSLSKSINREIDIDSMIQAVEIGEKLVGNIRQTTMGRKGTSDSSTLKTLIIKELLDRQDHQISRTMLAKKMWMYYGDIKELDELMLSFDQAGLIKTTVMGNNMVYQMPDNQVQEFKRFLAGKNEVRQ